MNKIKTVILLLVTIVATAIITKNYILNTIKVDAVDELDHGIVTLKVGNDYVDYYYEYVEIDRSFLNETLDKWSQVCYNTSIVRKGVD